MAENAKNSLSCPLSNEQLIDLILKFVDIYNEPAGIELYSYQRLFMRRIISSILLHDSATITGLWSRQSGKSEAISSLAGALCIFLPSLAKAFPQDERLMQYKEGFWVGIFAPRLQQSGIIYERIRKRAERESSLEIYQDPDIGITISQSRGDQVSWTNGSYVISQTASEQSNVEGKTFHLVILDEAQLISRSKVSKEIAPMLAATNGSMVKIGTVSEFKGGFHDSIVQNTKEEMETGERNHFEFPYDVVIAEKRKVYEETKNIFHLGYEKWVTAELKKLGGNLDNEEFKMNFRLIWKDANKGAIDLEALQDGALDLDMDMVRLNTRLVAGLDFGKNQDQSVLTIMEVGDVVAYETDHTRPDEPTVAYHEKIIIAWHLVEGDWFRPETGQIDQIVGILGSYSVDTLVVDATGVGDPLCEALQLKLPHVNVIGYKFNIVTKDALYKWYRQEFSAGRIKYVASESVRETFVYQQFLHQHTVLEKHFVKGYIQCVAPEGDHDDYPDSGALANYAAMQEPKDMDIEVTGNEFFMPERGESYGTGSRADRYRSRNL